MKKQLQSVQSFSKHKFSNFQSIIKSKNRLNTQSDFELKYGLLKCVVAFDLQKKDYIECLINNFGQVFSQEEIYKDFNNIITEYNNQCQMQDQVIQIDSQIKGYNWTVAKIQGNFLLGIQSIKYEDIKIMVDVVIYIQEQIQMNKSKYPWIENADIIKQQLDILFDFDKIKKDFFEFHQESDSFKTETSQEINLQPQMQKVNEKSYFKSLSYKQSIFFLLKILLSAVTLTIIILVIVF